MFLLLTSQKSTTPDLLLLFHVFFLQRDTVSLLTLSGVKAAKYCPSGDNAGLDIAESLKKCSTGYLSMANEAGLKISINIAIMCLINLYPFVSLGYELYLKKH